MPTFTYNKLVRDKVPERMKASGAIIHTRELDDAMYIEELKKKLVEEAQEVVEETEVGEITEEIADVYEVIDALKKAAGVSDELINAARKKKLDERGGFADRVYMTHAQVGEDNPKIQLLRAQPHKYPEE